jgi:NADPH-dependent 2,4-dienoyl-CoA reductase/sulfur reductase-like enzyme
LLVIGGDAAGMSAATLVRRELPDADIVVIERGPYTSYSMCGIPYLVAGEIDEADRLIAKRPDEFQAMGIAVHLRTEAVSVDATNKTVRVVDAETQAARDESYDALLIATGAAPGDAGHHGPRPVRPCGAHPRRG